MKTNTKRVNEIMKKMEKGEVLNFGQTLGTACEYIYDKETAKKYWNALIKWHIKRTKDTKEKAIQIEASNLGYYKGYYDGETIERVTKLFKVAHPIFGW